MNAWLLKDANEMTETLADEIVRWEKETRAILLTIKRVVEYFGTDEEYESLLAALRLSETAFEGVLPAFRNPSYHADLAGMSDHKFNCERSIAEKISPLLQLLAEPWPEFVPWACEELEAEHYKAVFRHYGAFHGSFGMEVCTPVWQSFPDLAPEGWPL